MLGELNSITKFVEYYSTGWANELICVALAVVVEYLSLWYKLYQESLLPEKI